MIFSMTVDPRLDSKVNGIGKALSKAAAFTLTDSATYAKADLLVQLKEKIDRPTPFTLNPSGYKVVIARIGADLNTMSSEMDIAPKQSAYEKFIFYFGPRNLGDAGASQKHIWVPGQRPEDNSPGNYSISPRRSTYGGVPNSYSQYLYELWQTQKRTWFSTRGHMGSGKYSTGGVFYGTIKGKTEFFARPKRTVPLQGNKLLRAQKANKLSFEMHQRGANGQFISTGKGDIQRRGKNRSTATASRPDRPYEGDRGRDP